MKLVIGQQYTPRVYAGDVSLFISLLIVHVVIHMKKKLALKWIKENVKDWRFGYPTNDK